MKRRKNDQELTRLRKIAKRDPGLLEMLDELKSLKDTRPRAGEENRRLRMPYVDSQPMKEKPWK